MLYSPNPRRTQSRRRVLPGSFDDSLPLLLSASSRLINAMKVACFLFGYTPVAKRSHGDMAPTPYCSSSKMHALRTTVEADSSCSLCPALSTPSAASALRSRRRSGRPTLRFSWAPPRPISPSTSSARASLTWPRHKTSRTRSGVALRRCSSRTSRLPASELARGCATMRGSSRRARTRDRKGCDRPSGLFSFQAGHRVYAGVAIHQGSAAAVDQPGTGGG